MHDLLFQATIHIRFTPVENRAMSELDQTTFNQIRNFLMPHCSNEREREVLVRNALRGCNVLNYIEWTGTARNFTSVLVDALLRYGECKVGEKSIVALLLHMKERVGVAQQTQIDTLIRKIPGGKIEEQDWERDDKSDGKQVFVAYSREDNDTVRRITTDLLNVGVKVWIDVMGLKPGTLDWEDDIRKAILESDAVLYMASPAARKSRYVRDELAIAHNKVNIIPLWVDGTDYTNCVPMGFGSIQHIDMLKT